MKKLVSRLLGAIGSVAILATVLVAGSPQAMATGPVDLSNSAGPLTHIWINQTLNCQVAYAGDESYEWYGPSEQEASCGTFLYDGGSTDVFGPSPESFFPG